MKAEITTDVKRCARCGEDHPKLVFKKLTRPGPRHQYWATCPKNQEPIMLRVVEMDAAQAKDAEVNGEQVEVKSFVFFRE